MKQRITEKQLRGLSEKGRSNLRKWWNSEGSSYPTIQHMIGPLLSIGQMIEFLKDNYQATEKIWLFDNHLVDKLWEACREILEKKEKV